MLHFGPLRDGGQVMSPQNRALLPITVFSKWKSDNVPWKWSWQIYIPSGPLRMFSHWVPGTSPEHVWLQSPFHLISVNTPCLSRLEKVVVTGWVHVYRCTVRRRCGSHCAQTRKWAALCCAIYCAVGHSGLDVDAEEEKPARCTLLASLKWK